MGASAAGGRPDAPVQGVVVGDATGGPLCVTVVQGRGGTRFGRREQVQYSACTSMSGREQRVPGSLCFGADPPAGLFMVR